MSLVSGCQQQQMYHSLSRDFYHHHHHHHHQPPPPPPPPPPSQAVSQAPTQRYLPSMESLSAAAGIHVPGLNASPNSAAAEGTPTGYFHGLMFPGSQQQQQQYPDYGTPSELGSTAEPYPHPTPSGHLYPMYDDLPLMLPIVDEDGTVPRVRTVKRRVSSNRKERRRTHSINTAFAALRGCIPNVPSDTKLSKIKTLRLATSYIAYLMEILNKDDPKLAEGGFKADISRKIESREEKRKRESEEILKAISAHNEEKPTRGRTGWPQQVWAAELKQ